jgi:DNA-3-methyladenine glycosylase II
MSFKSETIQAALEHLQSADPVMSQLIGRVGPFNLQLQRSRFRVLVRSIISQQISGSAAKSIRARLDALLTPGTLTPERLAGLTAEQLRSAGLSPQKATYLLDLAQKTLDGQIRFQRHGRMSDEQVIAELTQVKGIGRWTAQMFLIFSLGRLDVFPHDDLGIRTALRNLYALDELPSRAISHTIAESWRPYASVASWYCWRSLDLEKIQAKIV